MSVTTSSIIPHARCRRTTLNTQLNERRWKPCRLTATLFWRRHTTPSGRLFRWRGLHRGEELVSHPVDERLVQVAPGGLAPVADQGRRDVGDELDISTLRELSALDSPGNQGLEARGEPRYQGDAALLSELGVARQRGAEGLVGVYVSRPVPEHRAEELDDIAAQLALALQAEYQQRKIDNPEPAQGLRELFGLLQFSPNGSIDSPANFDGPAVVKQIQNVCAKLTE